MSWPLLLRDVTWPGSLVVASVLVITSKVCTPFASKICAAKTGPIPQAKLSPAMAE